MKKYKVLLLAAIVAVASVSVSAAAPLRKGAVASGISQTEYTENGDGSKMFKRGIRPENADFERKELTEEEKAEVLEKMKADLSEKLANGEMTEEEYAKALENLENGKPVRGMKKPLGEGKELTEEEKAEALEKMKADLSEKLANGEMTEEEYANALERLENGEPVRGMKKPLGEGKELTDEEIAEMKEKGEKPPRMKDGREKNKSEEE